MNGHRPTRDPAAAQQLVAEFAALVETHENAGAFPAPATTLPASKAAIKDAVRTVVLALSANGQLTTELAGFLEEVFAALANYVDQELASLAAEHRRASEALEAAPRQPRERLDSAHWASLARTSHLAGEVARASAEEAAALRQEFRAIVGSLG